MRMRIRGGIAAVAVLLLTACGSSGGGTGSGSSSADFVAGITQNATAAATAATGLVAETLAAIATADVSGLYQIAADAKDLHDHLFDWREDSLLGSPDVGSDLQLTFVDAENDLKNACGSVETWAGTPNAKTAAEWQGQMADAVGKWNYTVKKLWREAGAGRAPTITISS